MNTTVLDPRAAVALPPDTAADVSLTLPARKWSGEKDDGWRPVRLVWRIRLLLLALALAILAGGEAGHEKPPLGQRAAATECAMAADSQAAEPMPYCVPQRRAVTGPAART